MESANRLSTAGTSDLPCCSTPPRELAKNHSARLLEKPSLLELFQHSVDAVATLADIFEKKYLPARLPFSQGADRTLQSD